MECMHGKRYAKLCFTDLSCDFGNGLLLLLYVHITSPVSKHSLNFYSDRELSSNRVN